MCHTNGPYCFTFTCFYFFSEGACVLDFLVALGRYHRALTDSTTGQQRENMQIIQNRQAAYGAYFFCNGWVICSVYYDLGNFCVKDII